jgi:glycosyltransferase involved in cell wall biosynthesis
MASKNAEDNKKGSEVLKTKSKICYIVTPSGQKGGGMGRIKDYILQSGGDRLGRVHFEALDSRGQGSAFLSVPLILTAILCIWRSALLGRVAFVHVNMAERGSLFRKGLVIFCVRLAGVPVVLHLHAAELVAQYRKANRATRQLIGLPFKLATCCVVLGNVWRDWLAKDVGIAPEKIEVVTNGVPVTFAPRPEDVFGKDFVCSFLFLGNLSERKGLSDFIHALKALPQDRAWRAVVAGGGDAVRYKKLAENLGLSPRVNFTGWVDQAQASALLHEATALVLPSYDEGLPLVILEALGSGTPVIATPVGAIPEVLQDGRSALFVTPGNRKDLAEKMIMLIQNPPLRRSLSQEGLALYRSRFTIERFTDSLFSVYRRHCGSEIERAP